MKKLLCFGLVVLLTGCVGNNNIPEESTSGDAPVTGVVDVTPIITMELSSIDWKVVVIPQDRQTAVNYVEVKSYVNAVNDVVKDLNSLLQYSEITDETVKQITMQGVSLTDSINLLRFQLGEKAVGDSEIALGVQFVTAVELFFTEYIQVLDTERDLSSLQPLLVDVESKAKDLHASLDNIVNRLVPVATPEPTPTPIDENVDELSDVTPEVAGEADWN